MNRQRTKLHKKYIYWKLRKRMRQRCI